MERELTNSETEHTRNRMREIYLRANEDEDHVSHEDILLPFVYHHIGVMQLVKRTRTISREEQDMLDEMGVTIDPSEEIISLNRETMMKISNELGNIPVSNIEKISSVWDKYMNEKISVFEKYLNHIQTLNLSELKQGNLPDNLTEEYDSMFPAILYYVYTGELNPHHATNIVNKLNNKNAQLIIKIIQKTTDSGWETLSTDEEFEQQRIIEGDYINYSWKMGDVELPRPKDLHKYI